MLTITQFQAIDTHRFTCSKILKRQIFHADDGALTPVTLVNPYLGGGHEKNGPLFKSLSIYVYF